MATLTEFNDYGYATKSCVLTTSVQNNRVTLNKASLRESNTYDGWGKVTQVTLLDGITQDITYDAFSGIQVGLNSGINNGDHGEIKYTFGVDAFGNISARTVSGMDAELHNEQFDYDKLFRLTKYSIGSDTVTNTAAYYCYDALGNLLNKDASTNTCTADYTYGNASRSQGNAGVHAVSTITSKGLRFRYDNNGNMVEETKETQVNRHITYNADDQATKIVRTGVQQIDFRYGLNGRVWRQDTRLGAVPEQAEADNQNRLTFYHGALEKVITDGSQPSTLKRISLGSIVLTYHANTKVWQTDVLVKDNQGSTMAVANADGTAQHRYRYDPFGEQRTISTGYLAAMVTKGYLPTTQRGYTGHEMLNNVNIIHMNGRIYDPTIGRFLQADPHIQAPDNLQNYNRYSYVLNNPMSYTDPSGYFLDWVGSMMEEISKGVLKYAAIITTAIMVAKGQPGAGADFFAKFWHSASIAIVGSGIGNVVNGQHFFTGAIGSLVSSALFLGIGEYFGDNIALFSVKHLKKIALHAVVGGAKSYLEGGKFGHGFASAGVTQGFGPTISDIDSYSLRIVSVAVLGGTASALSGGSFSNGAETAAFSRLFNDELHTEEDTDNVSNEEQPSTQQESEQEKQSGNTEEPESLPYSPVPGVYQLKDGPFVSMVLNESGGLVNEDGTTAYSFDSSEGVLTNPRDTGIAGSVCPSCYFIGGLVVRGVRSLFAFRGYGWFGSNGLRVGQYRIDAFYSNARASGGTVFSIKGPYSRIRLDYGAIHKTSTLKWHVTIRFQVGPWKFGSTAQRKPYPPFKKFKK